MKHNLKINVSRATPTGGIVAYRSITLRDRLLTFLLGNQQKLMIIVPGNSVQTVAITEVAEGGMACETV